MEEITALKRAMADMVTKADLAPMQDDISDLKEAQTKMADAVEVIAAVKTGHRVVIAMSKLMAAIIAIYVFSKGVIWHFMESP